MTLPATKTKMDLMLPILEGLGVCELVWVTAEFAPFSSTQKPDVLFGPSGGPCKGRSVLFEVYPKFTENGGLREEFFMERFSFAEEYLGYTLARQVIVSGYVPTDLQKQRLAKRRISFIAPPATPDGFVNELSNKRVV